MAENIFLEPQIVRADFTILSSAATQALTSGVYMPSGAIVTGVTMIDLDALGSVQTNDSATIDLRVANTQLSASQQICSVKSIGYYGTVSIPVLFPLTSTAGVYLSSGGELVLSVQASSGTAARTFSPSMYVGYIA